jgi:hypothetical protein
VSTIQMSVKDRRPKKPFSSIAVLGWRALDLVTTHKTEIEGRLPGVGGRLGDDLAAINVVVPGAIQARNVCVALTHAQRAIFEKGCERARDIRETVRRGGAEMEVQKAYGVGRRVNPQQPGTVIAALQQIIERANKEPEEAAGFGLIAEDVSALSGLVDALSKADTEQDQKRASAPLSTKERNRTGNRIVQTIVLIAGAGRSAFVNDPDVRASFDELMESLKTKRPSRAKKKSTTPAGTVPSTTPIGTAPSAAPTGSGSSAAPIGAAPIGAPSGSAPSGTSSGATPTAAPSIGGSTSAGSSSGTGVSPANTTSIAAAGASPA